MVLKGERKLGTLKIATIYPMEKDKSYLLTSGPGGLALNTDFLAVDELEVVPITSPLDLETLKGKSIKEQVQIIFSRYLFDVQQQMAPLLQKQTILQKALQDRTDDLFESKGNIHI